MNAPAPAALWQGNDGFLLWDGARLMATDLDFTLAERLWPPTVSLDELAKHLDWLLITHEHEDHFSTATVQKLLAHDRCRFVIPESCREKAMGIEGLAERSVFCKPGDHLTWEGLTADCVRAVHGHMSGTVYSGASMLDCGYRFTFGGLHFYQPGDTILLEEHMNMQSPDVLFVSPTEHNMGVENAVRFIHWLKPKKIILQHHSTYIEDEPNYFWSHGYVKELLSALSDEERSRCAVPDPATVILL